MHGDDHPQRIGVYEVMRPITDDPLGLIYQVRHCQTGATAFARVYFPSVSLSPIDLARAVYAMLRSASGQLSDILDCGRFSDQRVYLIFARGDVLSPTLEQLQAEQLSPSAIEALQQRLAASTLDNNGLRIVQNPAPTFAGPLMPAWSGPGPSSLPFQNGRETGVSGDAPRQTMIQQQGIPPKRDPGISLEINIPVPQTLARMFSSDPPREPPREPSRASARDPIEQAFAELDPGWFSLDAPGEMRLGVATKVSAGAIRSEVNRAILAATLEHDQAQLEAAPLGRLVRVELVPDSEEEFQVRALSVAEQPVLTTEATRWEWLVTPKQPGEAKALRVIATNLADVNGQRVGKSRPVKTLVVRVEVLSSDSNASVSSATLRRICDEAMRLDADLEAFCLDFFPGVQTRFGRGMERTEKLNLLFGSVPSAQVMDALRQSFPDAVAAISAQSAPIAAAVSKDPPDSKSKLRPVVDIAPPGPPNIVTSLPPASREPEPQKIRIVIPIWFLICFIIGATALGYLLLHNP